MIGRGGGGKKGKDFLFNGGNPTIRRDPRTFRLEKRGEQGAQYGRKFWLMAR